MDKKNPSNYPVTVYLSAPLKNFVESYCQHHKIYQLDNKNGQRPKPAIGIAIVRILEKVLAQSQAKSQNRESEILAKLQNDYNRLAIYVKELQDEINTLKQEMSERENLPEKALTYTDALEVIRTHCILQKQSQAEVVKFLKEKAYPTKSGKGNWSASMVSRIVKQLT